MARQLNLDRDKVDQCYNLASLIVSQAAKYIDRHSTVSMEKATLLLMGLEGEQRGRSLADWLVESLTRDQLRQGAAFWWGRALVSTKEEPNKLAEKLIKGKLKWEDLPEASPAAIRKETERLLSQTLEKWRQARRSAPSFKMHSRASAPFLALRSEEAKPKKFFSFTATPAPAENVLRVVDSHNKNLKKEETVLTVEGLTAPEQIVSALNAGVQGVQIDGWHPVFKGSMAPERSLTDFYFTLSLCSRFEIYFSSRPAGDLLNTPQLLASLLLYEQTAKRAGFSLEKLIFSFAFPKEESSFLERVSLAQLLREFFTQSFLWLRSPSDIDPLPIWIANFVELDVVECSSPEQWQQVRRWIQETEGLSAEFSLNTHGKVSRQAHALLDETWRLLKKVSDINFWKVLDKNILFPPASHGLGKEGVFQKSYHYWNPLTDVRMC